MSADSKKSFVLYSDLIHTVEKMPDDAAGRLLKHILEYVNNRNPVSEDLMLNLVFEPIKQQMIRDLAKWEVTRQKRVEAGIASAEARKALEQQLLTQVNATEQVSTHVEYTEQTSTNPTVNVNENATVTVTVNDNVNVIKKNFSEKSDLNPKKSNSSKSSSMTSEHPLLASTTVAATDVQTSIAHPALAAALINFFDYQKEMGLKINKFTVKASIEKALSMDPSDAIESINTAISGNFPTFLAKATTSSKSSKDIPAHVNSRDADYAEGL